MEQTWCASSNLPMPNAGRLMLCAVFQYHIQLNCKREKAPDQAKQKEPVMEISNVVNAKKPYKEVSEDAL